MTDTMNGIYYDFELYDLAQHPEYVARSYSEKEMTEAEARRIAQEIKAILFRTVYSKDDIIETKIIYSPYR